MNDLRPIRSIALVVKDGNEAGEAACRAVQHWLRLRKVPFSVSGHPQAGFSGSLLPGADLVLAFAGDGTIVSVARQCLDRKIPIAGVNFGRVGFLAELSEDSWEPALEAALAHGLAVEPRMTLRYALYRNGQRMQEGEVVNDVVVTRGKVARLVSLRLEVDGEPLVSLRADGLILSTPTGSSGYSGSAGGPFLHPALNAYVVAATCPYLGSFPPLVLDPGTVFSVCVEEAAPDLYLTLDGQEAYPLAEGDCLEVSGVPGRFLMAQFAVKSYFERLRRVGFVREG